MPVSFTGQCAIVQNTDGRQRR